MTYTSAHRGLRGLGLALLATGTTLVACQADTGEPGITPDLETSSLSPAWNVSDMIHEESYYGVNASWDPNFVADEHQFEGKSKLYFFSNDTQSLPAEPVSQPPKYWPWKALGSIGLPQFASNTYDIFYFSSGVPAGKRWAFAMDVISRRSISVYPPYWGSAFAGPTVMARVDYHRDADSSVSLGFGHLVVERLDNIPPGLCKIDDDCAVAATGLPNGPGVLPHFYYCGRVTPDQYGQQELPKKRCFHKSPGLNAAMSPGFASVDAFSWPPDNASRIKRPSSKYHTLANLNVRSVLGEGPNGVANQPGCASVFRNRMEYCARIVSGPMIP